ncbi:MAG: PIN domain-containing protein, partial [Anaerolineae bacterium]|nr:PIN domain-containing protein [Anaerolineae bacterium]
MAQILIDTHVLVYAYDGRFPAKQRRAIRILREIREAGTGPLGFTGVLSAQVLTEFYAVVTRKVVPPLTPAEATAQLHAFAAQ